MKRPVLIALLLGAVGSASAQSYYRLREISQPQPPAAECGYPPTLAIGLTNGSIYTSRLYHIRSIDQDDVACEPCVRGVDTTFRFTFPAAPTQVAIPPARCVPTCYPEGRFSVLKRTAVSRNGVVAGETEWCEMNGQYYGILFPNSEAIQILPPIGVPVGDVGGVNDLGQMCVTLDGGAFWSDETGFEWLPETNWESQGIPNAINNAGHIVGYSFEPGRALLWARDVFGMWQVTILHPDELSAAHDINESDVVVGWRYNVTYRAVKWVNGVAIDLPLPESCIESQAWAVNNDGYIVGYTQLPNEERHAALWTPGGTFIDLNDVTVGLFGTAVEAVSINDSEHIAVQVLHLSLPGHHRAAFLGRNATPLPP